MLIFITGCVKNDEFQIITADGNPVSAEVFDPTKKVVFGNKIENPYSIENMLIAFNSLPAGTRGGVSADDLIKTTHKYLKFTLCNDEQYNAICRDTSIILSYYPLDLEIVSSGYYEDEGSEDDTRIRYTSVPIEKMDFINSCGVEYETLADMFMPDEDGYESNGFITKSGTTFSAQQINMLVDKSIILTGNESWLSGQEGATKANVIPSGTIKVDAGANAVVPGVIGLQGVKIKATRLLKVSDGTTNASGYFVCNKSFSNDWNYELNFDCYDFEINDGKSGNFCYIYKKTMSSWNLTIPSTAGKGYYIATIFRAAHHYYYEDILGLRRPPQNSFWKTKMRIAARYEENSSNGTTSMIRRFLGLGNAVHIFNPDREIESIYSTVIHELAHTSHWNLAKSDYNRTDFETSRVVESWAVGVSDALTKLKYPRYRGRYYGSNDQAYTRVVTDMIDTDADAYNNYGRNSMNGDNVTGYTLRQIEDCLPGARTFDKWRDNIYNKYPYNVTRNYLQTLFSSWYR